MRLGHAGKRKSYLTTVIVVVMGYCDIFHVKIVVSGARKMQKIIHQ